MKTVNLCEINFFSMDQTKHTVQVKSLIPESMFMFAFGHPVYLLDQVVNQTCVSKMTKSLWEGN